MPPGGDIPNGATIEKIHYHTCHPQALFILPGKVSGNCKAFPINGNLIGKVYNISLHHAQLAEQITSRLCAV